MQARVAILVNSVFLLTTACSAEDQQATSAEEFAADMHITEWVELWNTRDLTKVDEVFLSDPRLTYFSSEYEGVIQGPGAVREHHEGFGFVEGGTEPEQELWVEDVRSSAFGSVAVVTAVWLFGDRAAPPDSVSRGPMTVVYTWADDRYRIAHMHFADYEQPTLEIIPQ